jgi:DUF4097 and DUF4098 domain-containing protein YvlB
MKSKGWGLNTLGIVFALFTLGIVIFSIVYLTGHRDARSWRDYENYDTWERIKGERNVEEDFDSLQVRNISGKIAVKVWNRDYALVHYTKQGPFAEELEVIIEVSDGTLSVRPEHTQRLSKPFASVSFEIMVPGDVHAITAESASGSIELSGMGPGIDQGLRTVSGKIETDNARNLIANTTSGSIRFRFSGSKLYAKSVSGSVSGDILDFIPGGTCELGSVSGSVTLRAFNDLEAKLVMKSMSGSVTCEFPLQAMLQKNNELEGIIGNGASTISIKTTSGSVKLERL